MMTALGSGSPHFSIQHVIPSDLWRLTVSKVEIHETKSDLFLYQDLFKKEGEQMYKTSERQTYRYANGSVRLYS